MVIYVCSCPFSCPQFDYVREVMPVAALKAPLIPAMVISVNQHIALALGATL
jgi:hypothetical protein